MSLSKFESEIKVVAQPQAALYERFNDLTGLSSIKDALSDPATAERLKDKLPEGKAEELRKYAEGLTFEKDAIVLASPVGEITLRVVEREEPKLVKFASEGSPLPIYVWIQMLPHGDYECRLRVTVGAEVNFFMKGMVAKPLQQAADGLASMIAAVR